MNDDDAKLIADMQAQARTITDAAYAHGLRIARLQARRNAGHAHGLRRIIKVMLGAQSRPHLPERADALNEIADWLGEWRRDVVDATGADPLDGQL